MGVPYWPCCAHIDRNSQLRRRIRERGELTCYSVQDGELKCFRKRDAVDQAILEMMIQVLYDTDLPVAPKLLPTLDYD